MSPTQAPEPDWRAAVSISEDAELARELILRLPPAGTARPVSVTDLVAPRRAYWRAVHPVRFDEARQLRVDLGRALHRRLGVALSAEGTLEVRVRRNGVVGRIDLLSDVPVEVKTSASAVGGDELVEARPDQVEQLVMYCALADRPVGRLLTLVTTDGAPGPVRAADVTIRDLAAVGTEMQARAAALRHAWVAARPAALPACRWFGRGCEFQDAGVCDCTVAPTGSGSAILEEVKEVRDRDDVATRVGDRLREVPAREESPSLERFRDLVYPRRTYFERTNPPAEAEFPRPDPREPLDLYGRVTAAVESGPLGEVTRLVSRSEEPEEEVAGFRGTPLLLRTSRGREPARAATLLDYQPQYALELGFRAVATGNRSAFLILGRERAPAGGDPIQVFRYEFTPPTTLARLWRERRGALAAALLARAPSGLPACPEWMYADCPYRSECACGAIGPRSQR